MQQKPKDLIIELLKSQDSISVDELVDKLFKKYKISEREVKEGIWHLLEHEKITPDKQWNMKIKS